MGFGCKDLILPLQPRSEIGKKPHSEMGVVFL